MGVKAVQWVAKISVVGNAILFVLLAGGSHKASGPQVYPHKPVHLAHNHSVRLYLEPYLGETGLAQQAWDDAMKEAGQEIIEDQGHFSNGPFDAIVVDADQGDQINVLLWGHNQMQNNYPDVVGPPCLVDYTLSLSAAESGVGQTMKIIVLNTSCHVALPPGLRWRTKTHELGHVLGLGDDYGPYTGMMDGICCDDWPGDFQIQNYPFENYPGLSPLIELYPDEASCVRLLFNVPGKQGCNPE